MSRAHPRPPDDEGVPARTRILDAAEELFAENGYARTSTASLARHARVPNGLVFYYFPTKLDVLLALVRERASAAHLLPDLGTAPDREIHEVVADAWTQLHAHLESRARLRQVIFNELATHPEFRDRITEVQDEGTRLLARRLAQACGAPTDPAPRAYLIAARLLVCSAVLVSVTRGPDDPLIDPQELGRLIAHGLRGSDGT